MLIARILRSRSHIEYEARVVGSHEIEFPPTPADYGLGSFVCVQTASTRIVAVVSNTCLINPEYGSAYLSTPSDHNKVFAPDYIQEQGVMLDLLLLGSLHEGFGRHEPPTEVILPNTEVESLSETDLMAFHRDWEGRLRLGYYNQIAALNTPLAKSLLLLIISRLEGRLEPGERARLTLLRRNLAWQQTLQALGSKY